MNINLGKQALLFAANLSLPTFQVIAVNANLGCAHCRHRVTQVISKMAGSKKFTIDICRKQVIVKGDLRVRRKEEMNDVLKQKTENSSVSVVFKFLVKSFGFVQMSCCLSD